MMTCTLCGHAAYHPRLRPAGWVCAACWNADAGYVSRRRKKPAATRADIIPDELDSLRTALHDAQGRQP